MASRARDAETLVRDLLEASSGEARASAAQALSVSRELSARHAPALVRALDDHGGWSEPQSDWDGTVLGERSFETSEFATSALTRLGVDAVAALLDAPRHHGLLTKLILAASPEALARLSEETLARARAATAGDARVVEALAWRGRADLLERLEHHTDAVVAETLVALTAAPPTPAAANAVVRRLARAPLDARFGLEVQSALQRLSPLADDAAIADVLARQPRTPALLFAVAGWGARARGAGPALLAHLVDVLTPKRAQHPERAAALAAAVAATVGAPASDADPRVALFLSATVSSRGETLPPADALDDLVTSCGGPSALAPFVLAPLIQRLGEPDAARHVDAARRLFALKDAAAPAGDALLAAFDALANRERLSTALSALAWTLAHAGAARHRALPRFIALLEGEHVGTALHGLYGMAADAAAAIPALEACVARAPDAWSKRDAERTLTWVRAASRKA